MSAVVCGALSSPRLDLQHPLAETRANTSNYGAYLSAQIVEQQHTAGPALVGVGPSRWVGMYVLLTGVLSGVKPFMLHVCSRRYILPFVFVESVPLTIHDRFHFSS